MRARLSCYDLQGGVGVGIGVVCIALALRPPQPVSLQLFWGVIGLGLVAITAGALRFVLGRSRREREPAPAAEGLEQRQLVARECRRISEALGQWLIEHADTGSFGLNSESRRRRRDAEMVRRFRADLRGWALDVFDSAAALGGVTVSARSCVEAPSPSQLQTLPTLFQDAARTLERG